MVPIFGFCSVAPTIFKQFSITASHFVGHKILNLQVTEFFSMVQICGQQYVRKRHKNDFFERSLERSLHWMICMLHLMHSFFLKRRKFCSCSEKLCGSLYIFLILVPNFSFIILIYLLLVLSLIAIYQIDGYKILVSQDS